MALSLTLKFWETSVYPGMEFPATAHEQLPHPPEIGPHSVHRLCVGFHVRDILSWETESQQNWTCLF